MKAYVNTLKNQIRILRGTRKTYVKLRKHLDKQPVGYPATLNGVELRLLREIFTAEEAEAALHLDYRFASVDTVYQRAQSSFSIDTLKNLLESMESKGAVFVHLKNGEKHYALHPFVVGMFEMQIRRMTPNYYLATRDFMVQRFAIEYLTTEVPQMRVIPIEKSITPDHSIATYDEIRSLVEQAGDRICIADCICKTGKDLLGDSCGVTERREICMGFREFADTYARQGWGRMISQKEAMEILDQNEKDGLMLFPSTMQQPQFVCSCCSCCCGVIEMINSMPRPVDFAAGNYDARVDTDACNGCRKCLRRCQMDAILYDDQTGKVTAIDPGRCIGCGLCVSSCKTGSVTLSKKSVEIVPPKDHDALMELIMENKKSTAGKLLRMGQALIGR